MYGREGAIQPSSSQLLDPRPGYDNGNYHFDGRFYQTVGEVEYQRRQDEIDRHSGVPASAKMPLSVYQDWAELDWKEPQGTFAAGSRWMTKLDEEAIQETPDALYEYASSSQGPGLRQAAIGELGDVLWVTSALLSNAGQRADSAVQRYLWGDGLVSHREKELTLGKLDEIVADLANTPWFSPIDAFDPPELDADMIKVDEMEPRKSLFSRAKSLMILCAQQFGHGEEDGFTLGFYEVHGKEKIAPAAAELLVTVAWYARHFADSTLAEVVGANIQKLRPRVAAGMVDKEDGDRSKL